MIITVNVKNITVKQFTFTSKYFYRNFVKDEDININPPYLTTSQRSGLVIKNSRLPPLMKGN